MTTTHRPKLRWLSLRALGALFLVASLVIGLIAFQRPRIITTLYPGDTITATFDRDYRLQDYISTVKIAGVPVGTVTGVSETADQKSLVSLKLDHGTAAKLGTTPSAVIRPSTILGGKYYVDLVPGGVPATFTGNIPLDRAAIAVELDSVLESVQPQARAGLQQFIGQTGATLRQGGTPALQQLVTDAPATLAAVGPAADALTGEHPGDLRDLVTGLDSTARVLNQQQSQVASILDSFNATAGALDRGRVPLAATVGQLPDTLHATRTGMDSLGGSLDRLTSTAADLQPTADALDPLLHRLSPVVAEARPVVGDLRDLLTDARPLVKELVPNVDRTNHLLGDLRGPVLDNLNGPIVGALNSPWHGVGRYAGNSSPYKLYQDVAYAFANVDGAVKYTDANGATLDIEAGQGIDDISDFKGLPDFEQLVHSLIGPKESPR